MITNLAAGAVASSQTPSLTSAAISAGYLGVPSFETRPSSFELPLGGQRIEVSELSELEFKENVATALEKIKASSFLEHYFVLQSKDKKDLAQLKELVQASPSRKVSAGGYIDYCAWLADRIKPVGKLQAGSPVRQLAEHLISLSTQPLPSSLKTAVADYSYSAIKESFDLGAQGVQAVTTLLSHTRGAAHVFNVEKDSRWQKVGVDLLVTGLTGAQRAGSILKVEIKTENFASGNITLEDVSNLSKNTPGWLHYSEADVLIVCLWVTGDILLLNFQEVKEWALSGKSRLRKAKGTVPAQSYHSQIYLAPIQDLMTVFEDSLYLRLADWLPDLYAGAFKKQSLLAPRFLNRCLSPNRMTVRDKP